MPRGINWDDLPNNFAKFRPALESTKKEDKEELFENREFNFQKDSVLIGKRVAFGVICGGLTGACFGFVDVLRNPKMLAGKRKEGTDKVVRFTARFSAFFGAYHGIRKALKLYVPLAPELNVAAAAAACFVPMSMMPTMRPMIPYGIMMVILDAVNGINDI